jgi:hypothetical protein
MCARARHVTDPTTHTQTTLYVLCVRLVRPLIIQLCCCPCCCYWCRAFDCFGACRATVARTTAGWHSVPSWLGFTCRSLPGWFKWQLSSCCAHNSSHHQHQVPALHVHGLIFNCICNRLPILIYIMCHNMRCCIAVPCLHTCLIARQCATTPLQSEQPHLCQALR